MPWAVTPPDQGRLDALRSFWEPQTPSARGRAHA
jgi:hypothetical protein